MKPKFQVIETRVSSNVNYSFKQGNELDLISVEVQEGAKMKQQRETAV